jgi:hypothetical protein
MTSGSGFHRRPSWRRRSGRPRARFARALSFCAVLLILAETDAHAYTDPGSGTLLLQMAFAALFGLMFYARRIVAWVRGLVTRNRRPEPAAAAPLAPPETDGPPSGLS